MGWEGGTYDKVVKEPGERGAEHGLPVSLDNKHVRDMLLHSVLLILGRVDEAESDKEKSDGQHDAEAKVDAPDAIAEVLLIRSKHNQSHHTSHDEAKINGKVSGNGSKNTATAAHFGGLVGGLGRASSTSRVFA